LRQQSAFLLLNAETWGNGQQSQCVWKLSKKIGLIVMIISLCKVTCKMTVNMRGEK